MEYAAGNIFIREGKLDRANIMAGHEHNFDHVTYIAKGAARIEKLDAADNVVAGGAGGGSFSAASAGVA